MKKYLAGFMFFVFSLSFGQLTQIDKITVEELQQKSDPDYPEAHASILYRSQQVYYVFVSNRGFIQKNEIFERIKIYSEQGFDYATQTVRLYQNKSGNSAFNQQLKGLKAVTYNLDGTKITEDKLKKNGIFEEQTNKYWGVTKFTMPNIKVGSVIEFKYTIESERIGVDDIEFQKGIPVKKLEFKLKTPEYYKFKKLLNPKAAYIPQLNESEERAEIAISSKERQSTGSGLRTNTTVSTIDYNNQVISASLENIPPLKNESFVDNLSNYQSKLIMEIDRLEFPNRPIELLSSTWEKVAETIYEDSEFGAQLKKEGYYNRDIDAIITPGMSPKEKINTIFNYVKAKVKWNEFYGYTTDQGVARAYKEKVGNSADINLMLTSMLRYAGLNANPVLVSTKSNGIPLIPTRSGFNYVITGVETSSGVALLDATEKFSEVNILPIRGLNWQGRLIRQDGSSEWIELIPKIPSKELVFLSVDLNTDLTAKGKLRNQYTNYQAMRMRNRYENHSKSEIVEAIKKDKGEIEITELELINQEDTAKPFGLSYDFIFDEAIEEIGGKLYFSPLLFLTMKENPFKEDKRNYPIDFVYPINDKYSVSINLPEGYTVESIPESMKLEFNRNQGQFTFLSNFSNNALQFAASFDLNTTLIFPSDYEQFKKFYTLLIEKQTEKVVLKKI